eukprot:6255164-Prymnesium_polylepis.1
MDMDMDMWSSGPPPPVRRGIALASCADCDGFMHHPWLESSAQPQAKSTTAVTTTHESAAHMWVPRSVDFFNASSGMAASRFRRSGLSRHEAVASPRMGDRAAHGRPDAGGVVVGRALASWTWGQQCSQWREKARFFNRMKIS